MPGFETRQTHLPDGRRVTCWLDRAPQARPDAPVAVLTPGFGKRMHQHSALTQYLLANGVHVLRFDSVNHLGLSDGTIAEYSLTDGLISLDTATSLCIELMGDRDRFLVATSLTARIALRRFCADRAYAKLIVISGVVDVRHTLNQVFGCDYTRYHPHELPEAVDFESNKINIKQIYLDGHKNDWFSLERTLDEVARFDRPSDWFFGSDDEWIDLASVKACLAASRSGVLRVELLPNCGHDIGRNASVARKMMIEIVRSCLGPLGQAQVIEPRYTDILKVALDERRAQRNQAGSA